MIHTQKKLRVGETVKLNSGSPDLKVVSSGEQTTVEWFDGTSIGRATLPSICFKPV